MKHFFTFLAVSLVLSSFTVGGNIDEIITALKAGNAAQIAKYFDNTVEIALPDKSNSYSKSQGEMILKDFFTSNKVKSFQIKHRGENKDGSLFCVGTLQTSNGNYRTKFFMKQKGEQQVVQEIGFELVE